MRRLNPLGVMAVLLVVGMVVLLALIPDDDHQRAVQTKTVTQPQVTSKLNQQRLHPNGRHLYRVLSDEAQWYVEATDAKLNESDLRAPCHGGPPAEVEWIAPHVRGMFGKRALVTCPGGKG